MKRAVAITLAVACVIGLLVLAAQESPAGDLTGRLLFGWWSFAGRVLPSVHVSTDGLLTFLICLAGFLCGLHGFLRWMARSAGRLWRFRWTLSMVSVVVLMFVAGIAAAGVTHQTGWLLTARQDWKALRTGTRININSPIGSKNNLRQIGSGVRQSLEDPDLGREHWGRQSWQTAILPFVRMQPGGRLEPELPWDAPENSAYFRGIVQPYLHPAVGALRDERGYALSHYAGNVHVLGSSSSVRPEDVKSGTSQTILAGEVAGKFKAWGDPSNLRDPALGISRTTAGFGGPMGPGAQFAFLDGSVRFLRHSTDPEVLRRLSGVGTPP